ncbi:type II toxin-antitoxin system VapC family toxin [Deltaproteobacteria bacterium TL4]
MIYLPDTNVWINLLNSDNTPVKDKFLTISCEKICLCSIVKSELYYGAYKSSRRDENLSLIQKLSEKFQSFSFDDEASDYCGRIRAELSKKGSPIGPNDLLIAAIALKNNLTLVTHNTREFSRVEDLQLEDWEISA